MSDLKNIFDMKCSLEFCRQLNIESKTRLPWREKDFLANGLTFIHPPAGLFHNFFLQVWSRVWPKYPNNILPCAGFIS